MLIPDPRRTPLPNLISRNGVILYQWEFLASCTPSSTCCSLVRAVFRRGSRLPSFFDCPPALRAFSCCGQYSSSLLLSLSSLLLLLLLLLLPPPPGPRRFRAMSD